MYIVPSAANHEGYSLSRIGASNAIRIEEDKSLETPEDEIHIEIRAAGVNLCDAFRRETNFR
jgi:NADPH:quinone reductase-like Zn-dependent oxidoreductase